MVGSGVELGDKVWITSSGTLTPIERRGIVRRGVSSQGVRFGLGLLMWRLFDCVECVETSV